MIVPVYYTIKFTDTLTIDANFEAYRQFNWRQTFKNSKKFIVHSWDARLFITETFTVPPIPSKNYIAEKGFILAMGNSIASQAPTAPYAFDLNTTPPIAANSNEYRQMSFLTPGRSNCYPLGESNLIDEIDFLLEFEEDIFFTSVFNAGDTYEVGCTVLLNLEVE